MAVSKSHFNAYSYASKQVVIEHPPQQYKLAPNVDLNSDIFRCIVPFGGKALTSGGSNVSASTFNLPFTGTFTGQKIGVSASASTSAVALRYYEGATLNTVSPASRCYPSPTTGITNNRTYIDISSSASPAAVYSDYDVGSTEMVFYTAQHIQQAKLVNYMTPGVQGPYQMYFGFMPNDVSNQTVTGDPNYWWGFVYNLAVTSWSAPSSPTATHNTCNVYFTPSGANTYAAATDREIVMGFLKDTAWGKTAANILDSEIMLGGRLSGTTFNFIANGQVIYDPADETLAGAASPYTITTGAATYVGFGFAAGETTGVQASFSNSGGLLKTTLQGGTHNLRAFRVGDYITLHPTDGSTLPTTVTEGAPYYLKTAGANNYEFYLSATDAGGGSVTYAAPSGTFYAKVYGATDGLDHRTADPTDFNSNHSMQILVNLLNGGASTTSARQRFLRADVCFASTFYAVVSDLVTAGNAYVESSVGANVNSMYLDTMYGVSYELPDGFWQDETNCVEEIYGGQI